MHSADLGGILVGAAALLTAIRTGVRSRRRADRHAVELRALRRQMQHLFEAIARCSPRTQRELAEHMDSELLAEIYAGVSRGRGRLIR